MKQHNCMASTNSTNTVPSKFRASPRIKDVPKAAEAETRPKSVPSDVKANSTRTKRTILVNKPRNGEDSLGGQKGKPRNGQVVEQFAKPRRLRPLDDHAERRDDEKRKELEVKLEISEKMVKNLESEVKGLKAELRNAQCVNEELKKDNWKLSENLAAAEARIATLSATSDQESSEEHKNAKFKDIQKLIAKKLEHPKLTKEVTNEKSMVRTPSRAPIPRAADTERKDPSGISLPPPPPPPPLPLIPSKVTTARKAAGVVEFYQSLRKQERRKDTTVAGNHSKSGTISVHSSIVGEIQNRSAYLLAIKADIETKGEFVNGLIQRVQAAVYTDMEDVLKFVCWLDGELTSLADERAVLKHFKWPEKKADAMREAAVEFRELKQLESEISCYVDDTEIPCGIALKKMATLLDKSERSIHKLVKLRSLSMRTYQEFQIPTNWMLDSGIISKIKQASVKLANMYMKRVTLEFELVRKSDRESTQEALLLQGVQFAYRAHQFAGGLDSEALCAFEEIRQRVPGQLNGSRQLFAGIPSS